MIAGPPKKFLHPTDRRKQQRKLYGSVKWERVRAAVLARDNYLCQVKASKKCRVVANTVDHIIRSEEGGAEYDFGNLRASCRSCNMVRHNVSYFREKADAQAAEAPSWRSAPSPVFEAERRTDRPVTADPRFAEWAMGLHGVSSEPKEHRHGRWEVAVELTRGGVTFRVCPASCASPVRWTA